MGQHDEHSPNAAKSTVERRCVAPFDRQDPDQQGVIKTLAGFRLEGPRCNPPGRNGVHRSLTIHRDVLDAAGLGRRLAKTFLDRRPPGRDGFDDADGSKTLRGRSLNPDRSILPLLTAEQKGWQKEAMKRGGRQQGRSCSKDVRSCGRVSSTC